MGGRKMGNLNEIAAHLLQNDDVQLIIGYGEGSAGRVRPLFVSNKKATEKLLFDSRCTQNLASYLYKKEITCLGKPAIVANIRTLRGIIRLAAEHQLEDETIIALAVSTGDDVKELRRLEDMEQYLSEADLQLKKEDKALLDKLNAMTIADRWAFWQQEMAHCIKCYACRQACPLCYCTQCTVEINQPQWIPVASSKLGNMEWHIMRSMHLAGRCIECGQCGEACPANIPIHLLPIRLAEEIRELYGSVTGISKRESCEMSSFQPDDKEKFIT
ncbi:MAG: 4Fe-4S dicluster domain-containing protein [Dysgonamonadaceae bacterium]|jgi:ferredoxin|nr:4Fe-4S dicluster domain-containing protein [Dysgonamonadaceae bacterium]